MGEAAHVGAATSSGSSLCGGFCHILIKLLRPPPSHRIRNKRDHDSERDQADDGEHAGDGALVIKEAKMTRSAQDKM